MPTIFLSYRRQDAAGHAGRLADSLIAAFGSQHVFMDIDAIRPGTDFVDVIDAALDRCDVLLAVIGAEWLDSRDAAGRRRLDDPEDFVRVEIGKALARDVRVVPVLVQGATMPRADELPDDLAPLARRQAFELSDTRWRHDADALVRALSEQPVPAARPGNRVLQVGVIAAVSLVLGVLLVTQLGRADDGTATTTTRPATGYAYGTGPCPAEDGSSPRKTSFADAPAQCIDSSKSYTAVFHTTEGDVTVSLDADITPGTTNNFVTLARYHYYDDTTLFRTDPSIGIIQGGAPTTNSPSDPGPGYTIPDEGVPFTYEAGDLVFANTSAPHSSGAQFFFGANDAVESLDRLGTYLKFGHVTAGLDVLEDILALHVADPSSGLGGAPSRTVTVESVEIQESPGS